MGKTRIKGEPDGAGVYHVMSRTVADAERGGMMFFGAREKNVFSKQLRKHAEFAGIEVLTWCMMDNHFHLLIRVPERREYLRELMANGRKKFWRQLRILYSPDTVKAIRDEVEGLEQTDPTGSKEGSLTGNKRNPRAEAIVETYTARMADLSAFTRDLKRSFSVWFNRKHGRKGTLWMDRFKSVLLEGEPWVLKKVAAYIDLNPVRAGLVKDPGNYRWSGYGQSLRGTAEARRGLSSVYGYGRNEWKRISRIYRQLLYLEGVEVKASTGKVLRAGVSNEDVKRESGTDARGTRSAVKQLARQVRHFSDGAALGSREFLENVFERHRSNFGPARQSGARKIHLPGWKGSGWFSLRDLGSD